MVIRKMRRLRTTAHFFNRWVEELVAAKRFRLIRGFYSCHFTYSPSGGLSPIRGHSNYCTRDTWGTWLTKCHMKFFSFLNTVLNAVGSEKSKMTHISNWIHSSMHTSLKKWLIKTKCHMWGKCHALFGPLQLPVYTCRKWGPFSSSLNQSKVYFVKPMKRTKWYFLRSEKKAGWL